MRVCRCRRTLQVAEAWHGSLSLSGNKISPTHKRPHDENTQSEEKCWETSRRRRRKNLKFADGRILGVQRTSRLRYRFTKLSGLAGARWGRKNAEGLAQVRWPRFARLSGDMMKQAVPSGPIKVVRKILAVEACSSWKAAEAANLDVAADKPSPRDGAQGLDPCLATDPPFP